MRAVQLLGARFDGADIEADIGPAEATIWAGVPFRSRRARSGARARGGVSAGAVRTSRAFWVLGLCLAVAAVV